MSSRSYVVVRVRASSGLEGHGYAFGRGLPIGAIIREALAPLLVGADARFPERDPRGSCPARTGHIQSRDCFPAACSAVDLALWDLIGKRAGLPVADLLGRSTYQGRRLPRGRLQRSRGRRSGRPRGGGSRLCGARCPSGQADNRRPALRSRTLSAWPSFAALSVTIALSWPTRSARSGVSTTPSAAPRTGAVRPVVRRGSVLRIARPAGRGASSPQRHFDRSGRNARGTSSIPFADCRRVRGRRSLRRDGHRRRPRTHGDGCAGVRIRSQRVDPRPPRRPRALRGGAAEHASGRARGDAAGVGARFVPPAAAYPLELQDGEVEVPDDRASASTSTGTPSRSTRVAEPWRGAPDYDARLEDAGDAVRPVLVSVGRAPGAAVSDPLPGRLDLDAVLSDEPGGDRSSPAASAREHGRRRDRPRLPHARRGLHRRGARMQRHGRGGARSTATSGSQAATRLPSTSTRTPVSRTAARCTVSRRSSPACHSRPGAI